MTKEDRTLRKMKRFIWVHPEYIENEMKLLKDLRNHGVVTLASVGLVSLSVVCAQKHLKVHWYRMNGRMSYSTGYEFGKVRLYSEIGDFLSEFGEEIAFLRSNAEALDERARIREQRAVSDNAYWINKFDKFENRT